nr:hypothetical protein Q903MT_gene4978 [Picea sitchensis]
MFLPRWAGMHGLAAQFGCSAWILAWACIGYLDWLGSTVIENSLIRYFRLIK